MKYNAHGDLDKDKQTEKHADRQTEIEWTKKKRQKKKKRRKKNWDRQTDTAGRQAGKQQRESHILPRAVYTILIKSP